MQTQIWSAWKVKVRLKFFTLSQDETLAIEFFETEVICTLIYHKKFLFIFGEDHMEGTVNLSHYSSWWVISISELSFPLQS